MNHINRIAALLISTIMLTACTAEPKRGRVIDYDTKQPIEGAMVIGYWVGQKFNPVIAQSGCIGPAVVKTDRDGMFTYPTQREWFGLKQGDEMSIAWVYKPGHVYYYNGHQFYEQVLKEQKSYSAIWELVMKKDLGTANELVGFTRVIDEKYNERQGLGAQIRDFGCVANNRYEDAKRQGMCEIFQEIGEELYRRGTTREHFSQAYTYKAKAEDCRLQRVLLSQSDSPELKAEYEANIKALPK
jgi:hypothetical protein